MSALHFLLTNLQIMSSPLRDHQHRDATELFTSRHPPVILVSFGRNLITRNIAPNSDDSTPETKLGLLDQPTALRPKGHGRRTSKRSVRYIINPIHGIADISQAIADLPTLPASSQCRSPVITVRHRLASIPTPAPHLLHVMYGSPRAIVAAHTVTNDS